jgi:hypothetical protein
MSEEKHKPEPKPKPSVPDPAAVEASIVTQQAREVVEVVGADAVLIVWTKQRRRKTSVSMTSLGNALTVAGLMKWIADKVEEAEEDDDEDDGEDDE